ncbi:MAG: tRNA (adenosine(37)-N6)-threonylcarbamoyltransferase complex dimerization subunit type 1 TsaB, partial [Deltaproteobacteria bacterium]|nr:tRNA (adenosine(37)-N6)-threonylcarbamoyltransferase complex dimerization subunit type 1 TsaB [Deltaproteobacteria bacterium]
MLTLAFDTSSVVTVLSLCRFPDDAPRDELDFAAVEVLDERIVPAAKGHSGTLPPLVAEVARKIDRLGAIAVGCGPGSFTGLRTGLALAKGLGLGFGVPVLGLSTLTVLAGAVAWGGQPRPGRPREGGADAPAVAYETSPFSGLKDAA